MFIIAFIFLFIFKDNIWGEQSFSFFIGVMLSQFDSIKLYLIDKKYKATLVFFIFSVIFSVLFLILKVKNMENYLIMNIVQTFMKTISAVFIIQFSYWSIKLLRGGFIITGFLSYELYLSHTLVVEITKIRDDYFGMIIFFVSFILIAVIINRSSIIVFKKFNINNTINEKS